jgi:TPR repeat protein
MKNNIIILLLFLPVALYSQTEDDAIDLGLSVKWASHNIGALLSYQVGTYFSWGETQEKGDYSFKTYKFLKEPSSQMVNDIGNDIANTEYDAAHILWGNQWRMPTYKEVVELCMECSWKWTNSNGVGGYKVTGKNGNSIFLPACGQKSDDLAPSATEGKYWTSTLAQGFGRSAVTLIFDKDGKRTFGEYRIYGQCIRPVMVNEGYHPTSNIPKEWSDSKYKSMIEAINSEKYEEAFVEATTLAATGDAPGQCVLASMFMTGTGTYRNYEAAQELLAKAAKQGYERGEYLMGGFGSLEKQHDFMKTLLEEDTADVDVHDNNFWFQMLSTETKPDNFKDAFKWFYLEDGEWGYRDIMYYAGTSLIKGSYGFQNKEKGLNWIIRSAKLGYNEAIELLNQLTEHSETTDE